MQENILTVQNLCKSFKDFSIKNINLTVPTGKIMGYVGQNGAGKTTTLKLLMNILKKDDGDITLGNINLDKKPNIYKEQIGYIADDCIFPVCYTAKDVMGVYKSLYKTFDATKFNQYLTDWDLPLKKPMKNLSQGMQIKLMLAAALSRETKLLVLDEPTSGLDVVIRAEILDILRDYVKDGEHSVIFSTHITSDLDKIADIICFIDGGEIIVNDTKQNVIDAYSIITGNRGDLVQEQKDVVIGYKIFEPRFEALIKSSDASMFPASNFKCKPANIEQIIIYTIKSQQRARLQNRDASQYGYKEEK